MPAAKKPPKKTTKPGPPGAAGLRTERCALDQLHQDPANARRHPEKNMASIVGSLRQFGQVEPLVVQAKTGRVIGGNGRYAAMVALGWTHADVVKLDIDDTHAAALGIALNRTSELAEWDPAVLARLLTALRDDAFALDGIGFDDADLKRLIQDDDADLAALDPGPQQEPDAPPADAEHVRMVQLFFSEHQYGEFTRITDSLAKRYGTENITDTTLRAAQDAYAQATS